MQQYKKHETIFSEGQSPSGLFCITEGKVKLIKHGLNGKETLLRILGPGDIIGIRGILSDKPYAVTAETMEPAHICYIDKGFFNDLVKSDPHLAMSVIHKLSAELSKAEDQMSDMSNKNVRQRLSQLLISLKKSYGKKQPQGVLLDVALTRVEIASMMATTPETVIRILSDFSDLNYILLEGKKIYILNESALLDECGQDL